jgi:ketosteroid isomerase-like protein
VESFPAEPSGKTPTPTSPSSSKPRPSTRSCNNSKVLHADAGICYPCPYMDTLTEDDHRQIEQIHSSWIEFEIAGASHHLMTFCADDVEFCPPDAQPVGGRAEVAMYLAHGTKRIHSIEIGDRRIRGSNEIAYLTANYKTTFSSTEDSPPKQGLGSHLWILQKGGGKWLVTLVSWSVWR